MPSSSSKSSSKITPPKYHSSMGPIMSSSQLPSYTTSTPGFFQTMKEGFALGAGSTIGSKVVNSIFGSTSSNYSGSSPGKCEVLQNTFDSCIKERKPVEECEKTLDLLNKCLSKN